MNLSGDTILLEVRVAWMTLETPDEMQNLNNTVKSNDYNKTFGITFEMDTLLSLNLTLLASVTVFSDSF